MTELGLAFANAMRSLTVFTPNEGFVIKAVVEYPRREIPTKSFTGSYGRFGVSAAVIVKAADEISSVGPSGVDVATMLAPIVPPAPVRVSMTTGCPRPSLIFVPMRRARTSDVPPGENGTTMRTGL